MRNRMKEIYLKSRSIFRLLRPAGIKFLFQYKKFIQCHNDRFDSIEIYPIYGEDVPVKYYFDKHYLYHVAWAVRVLKSIGPKEHVDISSSLYFSATASAFFKIKHYDYRPPELLLDNLEVDRCDVTHLHFEDESLESLSCMHVIEHIGLGRYGDPLNYDGDIIAIKELKRVVKKDGYLLFVVPISHKSKVRFNGERVYTFAQIQSYFSDMHLINFALITSEFDGTGLIQNPSDEILQKVNHGCGCFLFKK